MQKHLNLVSYHSKLLCTSKRNWIILYLLESFLYFNSFPWNRKSWELYLKIFLFSLNFGVFETALHKFIISWGWYQTTKQDWIYFKIKEHYHENRVNSQLLLLECVLLKVFANAAKQRDEVNKLTKRFFILRNEFCAKCYFILLVLPWNQYTVIVLGY